MKFVFKLLIFFTLISQSYSNVVPSNWAYKITYGIEDNFDINDGDEVSYVSDAFHALTNEFYELYPEELISEDGFSHNFDESRTNILRWASIDFSHLSNTFSKAVFRTTIRPDPEKEMSWNDSIIFFPSLLSNFQNQDRTIISTNGNFQYDFYEIDLGNGGSINDVEFLSRENGVLTYNYFTERYLRNSYFDFIWETTSEPSLLISGAELIIDFSNFTAHENLIAGNGYYQNLDIMSELNSSQNLEVMITDDTSWDYIELYLYTNNMPKLEIVINDDNELYISSTITSEGSYKLQKTQNLNDTWVDVTSFSSTGSISHIDDLIQNQSFYRIILD